MVAGKRGPSAICSCPPDGLAVLPGGVANENIRGCCELVATDVWYGDLAPEAGHDDASQEPPVLRWAFAGLTVNSGLFVVGIARTTAMKSFFIWALK